MRAAYLLLGVYILFAAGFFAERHQKLITQDELIRRLIISGVIFFVILGIGLGIGKMLERRRDR